MAKLEVYVEVKKNDKRESLKSKILNDLDRIKKIYN
jgi:hypothetical protein